jgi:hypothetical protein
MCRFSPPPALRATSPVEGEEGGELGALPPLDGEGAKRSEAGGVAQHAKCYALPTWEKGT